MRHLLLSAAAGIATVIAAVIATVTVTVAVTVAVTTPTPAAAQQQQLRAELIRASMVAQAAHASDGTGRARGGAARFTGGIGARGVTFNGYQYVVFYTARDRSRPTRESWGEVVVGRRDVRGNDWQYACVPTHRITSEDAHNRPAIAISEGDGRIHLTFDHHNDPQMNYASSARGAATNPAATPWDDTTFAYQPNFGWTSFRWSVTYPAFTRSGAGDLLLYFRDGGSGNGEMQKLRYDSAAGTWEPEITRLSASAGTYEGRSGNRGPYTASGIQVGPDGSLHMSWLWREGHCNSALASSVSGIHCNHGLFYARSTDGGRSWLRSDGTLIADTSRGEAISIDNIGGPAMPIPMALSPSNPAQAATIDPATGDFHLLISHRARPNDEASRGVFHYVRSNDGRWRVAPSTFRLSGGELRFAGDTLYALAGERATPALYAARRSEGFAVWRPIALPRPAAMALNANAESSYATWDTSRIDDGVVSLMWQLPAAPGAPVGTATPVWVIDYGLPG